MPSVYFLVCHGSRDPRFPSAAQALSDAFSQRLRYAHSWATAPLLRVIGSDQGYSDRPLPELRARLALEAECPIGVGYLECADLPLHQQIVQFVQRLPSACGEAHHLTVVPLFLSPGVHMMDDIPLQVALAQQALPDWSVATTSFLGSSQRLRRILTEQMASWPMSGWILMAHGSRRPGANAAIETLADYLGAVPAYWSVAPSFATQVAALYHMGLRQIGILPYLLFPGGIIDAVSQQIAPLQQTHPGLALHLIPPLHQNPAIADLLVDLALTSP